MTFDSDNSKASINSTSGIFISSNSLEEINTIKIFRIVYIIMSYNTG